MCMKSMQSKIGLILHDIRSEQNVGSIFRTADAAGVDTIYISGITPSPIDRFGRPVGTIAKTALGAEKMVQWEKTEDVIVLISNLKKRGYQVVSIEQSPDSVPYSEVAIKKPVVFIVGNEVQGVPSFLLKESDIIAEIPMRGILVRDRDPDDKGKESLNVSVAVGIALFRILTI